VVGTAAVLERVEETLRRRPVRRIIERIRERVREIRERFMP